MVSITYSTEKDKKVSTIAYYSHIWTAIGLVFIGAILLSAIKYPQSALIIEDAVIAICIVITFLFIFPQKTILTKIGDTIEIDVIGPFFIHTKTRSQMPCILTGIKANYFFLKPKGYYGYIYSAKKESTKLFWGTKGSSEGEYRLINEVDLKTIAKYLDIRLQFEET